MRHCCKDMDRHINDMCDKHDDPFKCPDFVISYIPKFDEYGLIIHDGGRSTYDMNFCPFCGSKLPKSRRSQWFEDLNRMGYNDPHNQQIPPEYKTRAWYMWKKDK